MKAPKLSKPSEASKYLRFVFHGLPGSGKTTLAADMFKNPLIVQFDPDGTLPLRVTHPQLKENVIKMFDGHTDQPFEDLKEYLEWAKTQGDVYDGLILDTWTYMQLMYIKAGKAQSRGGDLRQVYGRWADYSRDIVELLVQLPMHVVVIANSKIGKDAEGDEKVMPGLTPGSIQSFQEVISFAFYVSKVLEGDDLKRYVYTEHDTYWTKERAGTTLEHQIDVTAPGSGRKVLRRIIKAMSVGKEADSKQEE